MREQWQENGTGERDDDVREREGTGESVELVHSLRTGSQLTLHGRLESDLD